MIFVVKYFVLHVLNEKCYTNEVYYCLGLVLLICHMFKTKLVENVNCVNISGFLCYRHEQSLKAGSNSMQTLNCESQRKSVWVSAPVTRSASFLLWKQTTQPQHFVIANIQIQPNFKSWTSNKSVCWFWNLLRNKPLVYLCKSCGSHGYMHVCKIIHPCVIDSFTAEAATSRLVKLCRASVWVCVFYQFIKKFATAKPTVIITKLP